MNPVSNFKPFWCHSCQRQILLNSSSLEIRCSNCRSDLIEEVENFDQHPSRFIAQGLEPRTFPRIPFRNIQVVTRIWFSGHAGAPPATSGDINLLEDVDVEGGECAVCQEELGDRCKKMRCGHVYHFDCLAPWLRIHNTCPVCRLPIR